MERRKFVQFGSVGVAAGLSGCIGPLPDPLGLTEDDSSNDQPMNGNETDDEVSLPDPADVETPEYVQFIPTESQNDSDGVFGFHIDLSQLSDKFTDTYEGPYDQLSPEDSPTTLSTGNSLQASEPTLEDQLSNHPGWSDMRGALEFNDEDFTGFQVEEYMIVENSLIVKSDIDENYITSNWGLESNEDSTIGTGQDQVALHEGWMIMTFDDTEPTTYADIYDGDQSVDQNADSGVYYDGLDNGDVTTFGFGSNVVTDNSLGSDINNIVSVADFNGDLETVTHLELTSALTDEAENELGSNANDVTVEEKDHFIRVVAEW